MAEYVGIHREDFINPFFYDRPADSVAKDLIGKVLRVKCSQVWLSALIIETEAYLPNEPASHGSLRRTPKREALYMPPALSTCIIHVLVIH